MMLKGEALSSYRRCWICLMKIADLTKLTGVKTGGVGIGRKWLNRNREIGWRKSAAVGRNHTARSALKRSRGQWAIGKKSKGPARGNGQMANARKSKSLEFAPQPAFAPCALPLAPCRRASPFSLTLNLGGEHDLRRMACQRAR